MSRSLLLIAYHFPPDNAIGGARPFRFYKYLKRLPYDCHVLTAAPQTSPSPDIQYVPDPLRVRPRQGLAWQAERIGWKFLVRAELALGWSQAVWRAGRSFLDARKGQNITILSSAPPFGTHLAAWRLARYSGRHWIADFRDPIHSPAADQALLQGMIGPRCERAMLKGADLVLANTDSMRDSWGSQPKIHVLWNGFDPEDEIHPYPLPHRDRKIVSHVGELYGGRDIRPIVQAVARLAERGPAPLPAIKIVQIGDVDPADLPDEALLRRAQAAGWLELRQPVPAPEARAAALDSDGLLLVQPHTAVQVPGKLFEYLRMGRPIFAYVVPGSPVERILDRAGVPYDCIYPAHSPQEIDERLLSFCGKLNGLPVSPSPWFQATFEASHQAEILDGLIRSLS